MIFLHIHTFIRRTIALFIMTAMGLCCAQAQVGLQLHDFCIGVNGGYSFNKVAFTPKINQKYMAAPTMGLTLRYTSERYYGMYCAFQSEINYHRTGWKENIYSSTNEPLPDTYHRDLSYIQVPILANLGFGRYDKGIKGYLVAGPQLSYLLSDKEVRSETWTSIQGAYPDRMNNIFSQYGLKVENKFEYGITAGLGAELTTRAGHFLVEGRYYMGLSNLFGNAKTDPFARSSNGSIVAKVTYLFDVSH